MNEADQVLDIHGHAQFALEAIRQTAEKLIAQATNRNALYVVIVDPRLKPSPNIALPILSEAKYGEHRSRWKNDYATIAHSKAEITWETRMSSREVGENAPYLYKGSDIKYPGSIIDNELIVAASGLDWQLDEAISKSVAAFFWASARIARDQAMADAELMYFDES